MSAVTTELAIMGEVHFGMRDMSHPAFWFEVKFGENLQYGSLMIVSVEEMARHVTEADVFDVKNLKGWPCQITSEGWGGSVKFVKLLKK
jgi:hypothetical protein